MRIANKIVVPLFFIFFSSLSAFFLEVSVRYLFPDLLQSSPCYQYHSRRYWTLRPNSTATHYFRAPNGKITWSFPLSISSQGLRDKEYGPKRSDEYRILMLGDSFVYGHGVSIENTIPKQLERLLIEYYGANISVINGGVGMYCPWQYRNLLNEIGFSFNPDMIMLGLFTGNDITDTMYRHGLHQESYSEKFYHRYQLLANRDYWNFECEYLMRRYWQTFSAVTQFLGWPQEGSLASILGKLPFKRIHAFPAKRPSLTRNSLLELNLVSWYPDLQEGYNIMWRDIVGIKADSLVHDAAFMFFAIPPMEIVYDTIWNEASVADNYERKKLNHVVNHSAHENDIEVIPVLERISSIDQQQTLYLEYDGHLNESGGKFVAEILFDYLINKYPAHLP